MPVKKRIGTRDSYKPYKVTRREVVVADYWVEAQNAREAARIVLDRIIDAGEPWESVRGAGDHRARRPRSVTADGWKATRTVNKATAGKVKAKPTSVPRAEPTERFCSEGVSSLRDSPAVVSAVRAGAAADVRRKVLSSQ